MAPVEREDTLDRAISRFDDAVSKFREVGSALAAVEGELHISASAVQCRLGCVVVELCHWPDLQPYLAGTAAGAVCGCRPIITSAEHNR